MVLVIAADIIPEAFDKAITLFEILGRLPTDTYISEYTADEITSSRISIGIVSSPLIDNILSAC